MYLFDNPVLQRELLVNLRMHRGFLLLLSYVALLGVVVYVAWPPETRLDLTTKPEEAGRLVDLFFLGQYILMSLMVPSFAAGAIVGEKERKTYEMLLASPMRPGAVVVGKLAASMAHLAVLVFCSLPIVMLCLPLGGKSLYEVLATYAGMAASVVTFGMICLAASSYFNRTVASQLVSYMVILPMALFGVVLYKVLEDASNAGVLIFTVGVLFPAGCAAVCVALMGNLSARLMHPPDVGAEAQEVVDLDEEQREAVGMVIRSDQFPDSLFTPRRRVDLIPDHVNPIFDKEVRSELFGHGTLMLRLVIQLSMGLALFVMAVCLYIRAQWAPWYTSYVLMFNMLVGPVFSAGSFTNERERQTLELLLTTTLSPWQILWGKLLSSLRISAVLTSFLVWPLLLAWLLPPWTYWNDTSTMLGYLAIILASCLTTTTLAMFLSVFFRRTSAAMMTGYLVVILLFAAPVAVKLFGDLFFPAPAALVYDAPLGTIGETAEFRLTAPDGGSALVSVTAGEPIRAASDRINARASHIGITSQVAANRLLIGLPLPGGTRSLGLDVVSGRFPVEKPPTMRLRDFMFTSPFAASFSLPLSLDVGPDQLKQGAVWARHTLWSFLLFYVFLDALLLALILHFFRTRWRVAQ
jgi:ABC-type transport system involved in multi-copper enzyme maturation permease subunit